MFKVRGLAVRDRLLSGKAYRKMVAVTQEALKRRVGHIM